MRHSDQTQDSPICHIVSSELLDCLGLLGQQTQAHLDLRISSNSSALFGVRAGEVRLYAVTKGNNKKLQVSEVHQTADRGTSAYESR
jgi:hypothetical protein